MLAGRQVKESEVEKDSMDMTSNDFENNLEMLGITGVEDLIQDDVQKSIESFREAGIKVWMLTGDKGSTA